MSTELATKPSALRLMADRCSVDPDKLHQTLKNTVFKGATDDEMLALVVTANVYELNPLLKELYAFPKKGGGITPMVGVDGWLKIANRQPNYDGMEVEVFGDEKAPTHATCTIFLKDRNHPIKITEYFEECRRNTDPWTQMPRRMLRNKVMIQTIRVAFGIGGIQDEDEAADIGMRETSGRVVESTTTKVITGNDTPAAAPAAAEPATKRQRASKAAPAADAEPIEAAGVEVPEEAEPIPSRDEMRDAIRGIIAAASISVGTAEKRLRDVGLLRDDQGLINTTDAELFAIYQSPAVITGIQPTEGGSEA